MVKSILPLRLQSAMVHRRKVRLVGPIDLSIDGRGLTIVMGPNGAGKTSLLRLMHGLERASKGSVDWSVPESEARRSQSYVFQTPTMMRRNVVDSVAYPLQIRGTRTVDAREKAHGWVKRVGIGHAAELPARVLSGGEKQKLALARALITEPEILFLDEPCANLDGPATRDIEAILKEARESGTRIIMATHDFGQARRLADDVLFILNGEIHEASDAEIFFETPQTEMALAFLRGDILE